MTGSKLHLTVNNIKKLPSVLHCFEYFALQAFDFLLRQKMKTRVFFFCLTKKKRVSLSLSIPLSSFWQVNLCLVKDERTVACFLCCSRPHYHIHILYGWGSQWIYSPAWGLLVKSVSLAPHCACNRVWPAWGSYWIGSCKILWKKCLV